MTEGQLSQIEEGVAATTPEPWTVLRNADEAGDVVAATVLNNLGIAQAVTYNWERGPGWAQALANACFIARARQDVPALLQEVRRLKLRVAELEQERDRLRKRLKGFRCPQCDFYWPTED